MVFNLPLNSFTLFQDIDFDGSMSPLFIISATIWYQKDCSINCDLVVISLSFFQQIHNVETSNFAVWAFRM